MHKIKHKPQGIVWLWVSCTRYLWGNSFTHLQQLLNCHLRAWLLLLHHFLPKHSFLHQDIHRVWIKEEWVKSNHLTELPVAGREQVHALLQRKPGVKNNWGWEVRSKEKGSLGNHSSIIERILEESCKPWLLTHPKQVKLAKVLLFVAASYLVPPLHWLQGQHDQLYSPLPGNLKPTCSWGHRTRKFEPGFRFLDQVLATSTGNQWPFSNQIPNLPRTIPQTHQGKGGPEREADTKRRVDQVTAVLKGKGIVWKPIATQIAIKGGTD